jgi:hypothetical protein
MGGGDSPHATDRLALQPSRPGASCLRMTETTPISPEPIVIPGQDQPPPMSPPEAPQPAMPPEIQPDATPVEAPDVPAIPGDESGRPFD